MRTNLFLIGEQKTATTSLHEALDSHPQIEMSSVKEPGFFMSDLRKEAKNHGREDIFSVKTLDEYHRLWQEKNAYRGESSTLYSFSKSSAKEIATYNPDAKIIYLVREPIGFLQSLHEQYLEEATESISNLERAWEESYTRSSEKIMKIPSIHNYQERVKFHQNIRRFLDHFHENQIFMIGFQDLIHDTESVLTSLQEWLNVQTISIDLPSKNSTTPVQYPSLRRFISLKPETQRITKKYLPHFVRQAYGTWVDILTKQNQSKDVKFRPSIDRGPIKNILKKQPSRFKYCDQCLKQMRKYQR